MNPLEKPQQKLITLNKSAVRNQRTLIWLQHQTATITWSKWDAVVTSLADYYYWSKRNVKIVGLIVIHITKSDTNSDNDNDNDTFLANLFSISKHVSMILISQAVLSLKSEEYWAENYDNLISLETAAQQYPFLGAEWDNIHSPLSDAVAIFAHLCRYNRLVDCPLTAERSNIYHRANITVCTNQQPEQIWLIGQYFKHKNAARAQEIKDCLAHNCANPHIDKIVQLTEKDWSSEWSSIRGSTKIQQCVIKQRLTYTHFLQFVHDEVPKGVYVILANSDIYFANSLMNLWSMNLHNTMLALLRWDVPNSDIAARKKAVLFGPRADSQDSWILLSDSVKDIAWKYAAFNFQLGQAGCDNAFAGLMLQNHFVLSNPALTLKTYHLHNSDIREYSKADYIKANLYVNIVPSYIIDTEQKQVPDQFICICNELVEFEVLSSSMSNEITYCTMLAKDGRYTWEPSVENHYFEPAVPVYTWNDREGGVAVTSNGLVYNPYMIYVGKQVDQYPYWANAAVGIFTPMHKCADSERLFAVPMTVEFAATVFGHPDVYVLHYLSYCLRLMKEGLKTSDKVATLLVPKSFNGLLPQDIHTITYDPNTAYWANDMIGFVPGPREFGREDMTALRSLFSDWIHMPTRRVCCVVVDSVITEAWVNSVLGPFFIANDSMWVLRLIRSDDVGNYKPFLGASMCVFVGGPRRHHLWAKLWALPKYCCVVEFQQELDLDGEFQHMAHVCDFKSWVLLLSRGSVEDVREQVLAGMRRWLGKNDCALVA